jgi:putative ABC transport system permease protein
MIRHLFKLVWNRKKTNALIMLEILFSFLVVFALTAAGIELLDLYRRPLGFEHEDVWAVYVDRGTRVYGSWSPEAAETFRRLVQEVRSLPQVEAAASANNAPYSSSNDYYGWDLEGRELQAETVAMSLDYPEVLGIELTRGRWFEEQDATLAWKPVVVNLQLATTAFGDEDPLGRTIADADPQVEGSKESRVVGVVSEFRRGGEFAAPDEFFFMPAHEHLDDGAPLDMIAIKLAPGTTADFEEPLLERMQSVARTWTFTVKPLAVSRESKLKGKLIPLAVIGMVGGFLLAMVVLGLIGVMWQNVTRRTREIGLRRATGAPRSSIHRQIVAEVMIIALLGVIVGALLAVQAPLIGAFSFMSYNVVLLALFLSAAFILLLAALCGLYPGWSATRVHPAEALHYE